MRVGGKGRRARVTTSSPGHTHRWWCAGCRCVDSSCAPVLRRGGGRPGLTVCAPERDAGWPRGGGAVLSAAATSSRPARRLITLLVLLSELSLGTSCIIDIFGRGRGRSIYLRDAALRSRSIILRVDPQRQRRPSCAQAGGFGTYVSKDRDQHQCLCVYMVVSPASWRLFQLA